MGRILVIGATGLIGAPVARRLLADGHQVRLLVRDTGRASQRLGDGFEYLEGSVTDTEAVDAVFLAVLVRLLADKEREVVAKHLTAAKDRE